MKKIQLTCAHAIVKYLISQKILVDGKKLPLFAGAFGIFGHGNVACLGQALEENQKDLPTWRGHHEQNMALTGIAYSRAKRRKLNFCCNIFSRSRINKHDYCSSSCNE